jgi:ornithine carbamoyltransferase
MGGTVMTSAKRDFLTLMNLRREQIEALIERALEVKMGRVTPSCLGGKMIGLLFGVASTRTRVSFQVAVHQLGGHAEYLNADDLQLIHHESLGDTAAVLSQYLDGLVVRMYDMKYYGQGRERLQSLAAASTIPVINALDDQDHPCQVMADLMTMRERYGAAYGQRTVALSWVFSERQKSPGVAHSLLTAGGLLGMHLRVAYPKDFDLDDGHVGFARRAMAASGGTLELCDSIEEAVDGADVLYVKDWKALSLSVDDDRRRRNELRSAWRVTPEHLARANPGAIFMNCMPIIRGEQAAAEVIDGPQSLILQQAANRLPMHKAILDFVMAG